MATTDNWDDYYSSNAYSKGIRWNDGTKTNISVGYRIWVLDDDKKPCGLFDIATAGSYGFLHTYANEIPFQPPNQPPVIDIIDEGADIGDIMSVLVEKKDTGTMYNAQFVDFSYNPITVTFQANRGRYIKDILVDPTSIPEPSKLALIITGALTGAGLGIRKKLN